MQFILKTFTLFFVGIAFSQQTISLDSCIVWAKKNYPVFKQTELANQLMKENIKEANENWIPRLNFTGQATYNTETIKFNFPGMNIHYPNDAYMLALNLEQTIVDGGKFKSQREIEKASTALSNQQNEVELYKLIDRVNQFYINILLGRENLKILDLYQSDLQNRVKNMRVSVQNGAVLASALDELEAELLKTEQNLVESTYQLKGLYQTLSLLLGKTVNEATSFSEVPLGGYQVATEFNRPELKALELQRSVLDQRYKLNNKQAIPTVTIGVTGNYGRPGPNFLNQNLRFFGSGNITMRWNISSLYSFHNEKTKLAINKNMIDLQQEAILFNLKASLFTQTNQLEAMQQIIQKDDEIIEKRKKVTATASSQMENGKITVVNYLSQLNAQLQAELNKKVHEIKQMNTISSMNATKGIITF
jgi:outer membrane protein TolC